MGLICLAAIATFGLLPASASAHHHSNAPKHKFGRGTSTNWSGYAVDGTNATHVIGSWKQPGVVSCATRENSWSSPWVGIDGDNSNTVEQIGTDTDCSNGAPTFYAWFEMYPKSLVVINSNTVRVWPGDSFTAEVTYNSSNSTYLLTLTNNTAHQSFSTSQFSKRARRTSVEWVMEGPSSGLLTNFGSIDFSGGSATIGGQTVSPSSSSAQSITMVTSQGVPRAVPTSASGGGFTVNWLQG
jgi:Peptidase A4 family